MGEERVPRDSCGTAATSSVSLWVCVVFLKAVCLPAFAFCGLDQMQDVGPSTADSYQVPLQARHSRHNYHRDQLTCHTVLRHRDAHISTSTLQLSILATTPCAMIEACTVARCDYVAGANIGATTMQSLSYCRDCV